MTDHITLPRSVVEQAIEALVRSKSYKNLPERYVLLGKTELAESDLRAALAGAAQAEPVAWFYWHQSNDTFDGPDTIRKKAVSKFTDDTRIPMQREGWVFEPLYTTPQPAQPVAVPHGWRELMREARDNCEASIAEDGVSAMRREYRKELLARIDAMLAAPMPPAATVLEPLTPSEMTKVLQDSTGWNIPPRSFYSAARAVEAAHAAKLAKRGGV